MFQLPRITAAMRSARAMVCIPTFSAMHQSLSKQLQTSATDATTNTARDAQHSVGHVAFRVSLTAAASKGALKKLLARLRESPVYDQVVAEILKSCSGAPLTSQTAFSADLVASNHLSRRRTDRCAGPTSQQTYQSEIHGRSFNGAAVDEDACEPVVSPLDILATAVATVTTPSSGTVASTCSHAGFESAVDPAAVCIIRYFGIGSYGVYVCAKSGLRTDLSASQVVHPNDWQVLAAQPVNSTLRLEPAARDPVTAQLVDQSDVSLYFDLFFKVRNPFVGFLDPILHTHEYVYGASFTLFSVICALGCAVSTRPRDRILYPTLLSLADSSMKWSIAASVKTIETVQAIINLKFWAPVCHHQSDDPYWLHLSHAIQLARELGIYKPRCISEQVNARSPRASPDFKERMHRNFERTWLYTFIADNSFGFMTGRAAAVSWKEISPSVAEWWRKPMTSPFDRVISGIIETRRKLLSALEQRKNTDQNLASIISWHERNFEILEQTRTVRCASDGLPSSAGLPVLNFYLNHTIMILNAQALRDVICTDALPSEFLSISEKTVKIASRLLDTVLSDRTLRDSIVGFHNNQFIMICHAVTEILYAIKRGELNTADADEATTNVRTISKLIERTSDELPAMSAAQMYGTFCRFFSSQLDAVRSSDGMTDIAHADCWRGAGSTQLELAPWFSMDIPGSDQLYFGPDDFDSLNELELDGITFL